MYIGIAVAAGVVIVVMVIVSMYNRLVRGRNGVENAFATIDVQLKQRCDLVPKLVDSVKGYMTHERGLLEELTTLRERASAPGASADERLAIDNQMSGVLRGVVARFEAYPQLKASDTVVTLQRSLNEVEAQIAAARRTFNASVTSYNTLIETVPTNLLAGPFGFTRRQLFEASSADRAVPSAGLSA